jgi:histidyl-tRNA synthetase
MSIQAIKGVKDVLPRNAGGNPRRRRKPFEDFAREIRVPAFEYTELFARSIGHQ